MNRTPFLPAFFLLLLCHLLAAGEISAEETVKKGTSRTNYTPGRGLVGYTRSPSAAAKKKSEPDQLVPPPAMVLDGDGAEKRGQIRVTESDSGMRITADAPFLSESITGMVSPNNVVQTAAAGEVRTSGLLSDGGFIPDSASGSSEQLVFDSDPNTFLLSPTGVGASEVSEVKGASVLPEPVLDTPPSETAAYSSIGAFSDGSDVGEGEGAIAETYDIPVMRNAPFQQLAGVIEYIPNVKELKSGMTTFGISSRFSIFPSDSDHRLMITPHFFGRSLTMPESWQPVFGEKEKLYSAGLQGVWLAPLTECLSLDLGLDASWNSDFKSSDSKAFWMTGRLAGVWRWNETTRVILGAEYRNAANWSFVPIAGISWRPTDDCYIDAVFPTGKIARRLTAMQGVKEIDEGNSPYWIYLTGELNTGRWSVSPGGETADLLKMEDALVSYSDYRILGGLEKRLNGDVNWAIEGGVVFSRRLYAEGQSSAGFQTVSVSPNTAGIARLRVNY